MPDHPKPTPAQRRILAYAKQHPEAKQKDIAKAGRLPCHDGIPRIPLVLPGQAQEGGRADRTPEADRRVEAGMR